jgi:predicted DNA-binding transcriptional regulator AlpA
MKITKKCGFCGNPFIAQKMNTKYCSHQCNQKHYRIKQKKKNVLSSLAPPIQQEEIIPYSSKLSEIKSKEFITLKECMILLSISRTTIWRLIKNKNLQTAKLGSKTYIKQSELFNLLNNQISNMNTETITLNKTKKKKVEGYYTIGEISNYYNMSTRTVERQIIKNNVKKIKKGRYVLILKSEIIKILGEPNLPT